MNILFMGSGDFALPILQKLYQKHAICAVYTAPFNQEKTRKNVVNEVEIFATQNSLILHKEQKITTEVMETIKKYEPDIIVVASYGFLLPSELLQIGKIHKPINIHPSLLPKWRGAAPIERAIENGDKETAICLMKMVQKMDAGDILLQQNIQIDDKINAIELRQKTAEIGAEMLLQWLENITNGTEQIGDITFAKKIEKHQLQLDFSESALKNYNKIRAFVGSGGCWFLHKNERIKILQAEYIFDKIEIPNFIDIKNKKIHCIDGFIVPIIMQREGKKIMPANDIFNGLK